MKPKRFLLFLLATEVFGLTLLAGCAAKTGDLNNRKLPTKTLDHPLPARIEIRDQSDLQMFLENRWTLERIRQRMGPYSKIRMGQQNLTLVPADIVWEGILYDDVDHEFDDISWYAKVWRGELSWSLNVSQDDNHWNIEMGDTEDLLREPVLFGGPSEDVEDCAADH